jgi:hypothetical protein
MKIEEHFYIKTPGLAKILSLARKAPISAASYYYKKGHQRKKSVRAEEMQPLHHHPAHFSYSFIV